MKRSFVSILIVSILSLSAQAVGKENKYDYKKYPYNNPVIKHMYTADAAPKVMPDGRVWMVTSVDHEDGGGYATMHKYHTFSSTDMVHWTDHGEVLNVWDVLGADKEPAGEDWALWAPDMVYRNGKYYLYFPVRILHTDSTEARKVTSYIAAAVSDAPDKRFTVVNPKIEGTRGIDPSVFIDDDGQPYLFYGSHWGAKLKENMIELDGKPVKMDVDDKHFMEAIWMHKRNGKYYVSYHTQYGKPIDPDNPDDPARGKSRLDYGVSDNPFGPFKYQGIMNYELGVNVKTGPKLPGKDFVPWRLYQSNHGGIVEYHGQEYLFYHTSALSSWRQDEFKGPGTWTQRSVCVDVLNYNDQGKVIPVQQTLEGPAPVKVAQPFEVVLGDAVNLEDGKAAFKNVHLGTGYYYFGATVTGSKTLNGRLEVRLDSPDGQLVGTCVVTPAILTGRDGLVETFLRAASGKHDVHLVFKADDGKAVDVKLTGAKFFAGSPELSSVSAKPKVWIYTDMSDKTLKGRNKEGTINDPDDISAMAGYLLMSNMFDTRGIVITSTHRKEHKNTPDQAKWADEFFGTAYRADVKHLNQTIGGYPDDVQFVQSCIKESAEHYNKNKVYDSLDNYPTVRALLELAQQETDTINVLCWGSLTEPAILVNHCMNTGKKDVLKKLWFIAHWTNSSLHQGSKEHPENVANCREDAAACAYLKSVARAGDIRYYECGAIGQHGIVSGSPKGKEYFDQFKASNLGRIFAEGKFVYNCVDHSDAATYWTLLGTWGVSLDDIAGDGTNPTHVEQANEETFRQWSKRIHDELLMRSNAAAGN